MIKIENNRVTVEDEEFTFDEIRKMNNVTTVGNRCDENN